MRSPGSTTSVGRGEAAVVDDRLAELPGHEHLLLVRLQRERQKPAAAVQPARLAEQAAPGHGSCRAVGEPVHSPGTERGAGRQVQEVPPRQHGCRDISAPCRIRRHYPVHAVSSRKQRSNRSRLRCVGRGDEERCRHGHRPHCARGGGDARARRGRGHDHGVQLPVHARAADHPRRRHRPVRQLRGTPQLRVRGRGVVSPVAERAGRRVEQPLADVHAGRRLRVRLRSAP